MVSGKIGEMYLLQQNKILNDEKNKIQLKYFSSDMQIELQNLGYQIVPEKYHEKCIYDIFRLDGNKVLTIGMDRKLNIFQVEIEDFSEQLQENDLNIDENNQDNKQVFLDKIWGLNLLGGKVSSLCVNKLEPELIFIVSQDNSIKSWDYSKK
ncbi:WD40-repeat-containing domain [Pseudocohnilembus persalinus]|uniref:WD40-repeat-containing domain n=1 Tax=Pseudocohnilembus persalinus TaxID=266149 RepID=A0A0V0R8F0_PSEPJ|nr:WD40-repeat-containing domain [Pseudocohnilembus persalinus]|eukprot:KRX10779.1 WD40-repeat-containing domain [Pseudocohnilembus persalinus]